MRKYFPMDNDSGSGKREATEKRKYFGVKLFNFQICAFNLACRISLTYKRQD